MIKRDVIFDLRLELTDLCFCPRRELSIVKHMFPTCGPPSLPSGEECGGRGGGGAMGDSGDRSGGGHESSGGSTYQCTAGGGLPHQRRD